MQNESNCFDEDVVMSNTLHTTTHNKEFSYVYENPIFDLNFTRTIDRSKCRYKKNKKNIPSVITKETVKEDGSKSIDFCPKLDCDQTKWHIKTAMGHISALIDMIKLHKENIDILKCCIDYKTNSSNTIAKKYNDHYTALFNYYKYDGENSRIINMKYVARIYLGNFDSKIATFDMLSDMFNLNGFLCETHKLYDFFYSFAFDKDRNVGVLRLELFRNAPLKSIDETFEFQFEEI